MSKKLKENTFITYIIENYTHKHLDCIGICLHVPNYFSLCSVFKFINISPKSIKKVNVKISPRTYPIIYTWSNEIKPIMCIEYEIVINKDIYSFCKNNILKKIKKNYIANNYRSEIIMMPPKIIDIKIKLNKKGKLFCKFKIFQ